jgi:uncharacterized protein (DUF1015 family)
VPRFLPFNGLRYQQDVAPIADVIAPPYDVVDDLERAELAARSPYNAIHVELPLDDPATGANRYEHAAALFAAWQRAGALALDDVPAFYVYRMRFHDEHGIAHASTGVIGALEIDAKASGSVLPHEETTPKPKGDRLDLLRATARNTSPIWGLSLSEGLSSVCAEAVRELQPIRASDDDGIIHELFVVSDDQVVAEIERLVAASPVVIADGHHRYETASFFRAEQRAVANDAPGDYDLVMALVVELTPGELFVQAIHRLVGGLPADYPLVEALRPFFDVREAPDDVAELARTLVEEAALGLVTPGANYYLSPLAITYEQAGADLDSSRLDVALAALPPHELTYQHGAAIAAGAVRDGAAQAAVLLRPATVEQIAKTAHGGVRMPPKTTFFYPKPRTGMVYRVLNDATAAG